MAYSAEPSSSISFTSSSHFSNGSIVPNVSAAVAETGSSLDILSLSKLSNNLEQLLLDSSSDFTDADIIVENIPVGVHRCILAARSKFFYDLFKKDKGTLEKEGKPRYCMSDLLPYGKVGYDAFLIFLSYLYTGKLKAFPLEVSTCVDERCTHYACRPAIDFAVQLTYASSVFQVPEMASLSQLTFKGHFDPAISVVKRCKNLRRLLNFVGKALVEDVIPILEVAHYCELSQLVTQCVDRIARSDLDDISLEKELPFEVVANIKLLRPNFRIDEANGVLAVVDPLHEKRIRSIHKALDCDDVELVKLLLSESNITLDEAYALHYAVAYCDPKVVSEVLGLDLADVNLQNARGYTVLHIAAMRKEPSIIVSLLTKGTRACDLTLDGQSAVSICRRRTRPKDYHAKTERGQEANKDRLCIDVLEREMWRTPMAVDASMSQPTMVDDLHMRLLNLENRVAFARLFFPAEAKLAMDIANAETTSEFAGLLASRGSSGNLREVDLNETPIMQNKRLLSRLQALMKTVELGRRYFPHCSEVLDKFMEDDLLDLVYLEKGTAEDQNIKRSRFVELKEDVRKAFNKDKAQLQRSGFSSSSSSMKNKIAVHNKARKLS